MASKASDHRLSWGPDTRSAPPSGRTCSAIAPTELINRVPEEIGVAPDLLGHADLRTTRKHYIQAQGITAHRRIQELIAARRRAASGRRRPGA